MSYCRFNSPKSQAYVIATLDGTLECIGCRITGDPAPNGLRYGIWQSRSRGATIRHLQEHRQLGWKVPFAATRRLRRETRLHGDFIA